MLCCVVGWVISVPLKDCGAFILRVKHCVKMFGSAHLLTVSHPMHPQQHSCEILKYGWQYMHWLRTVVTSWTSTLLSSVNSWPLCYHLLLELEQPRKSVQFSEAVQVKTVEEPQEVEINEEKTDRWDHIVVWRFVQGVCTERGCSMGQSCRNRWHILAWNTKDILTYLNFCTGTGVDVGHEACTVGERESKL